MKALLICPSERLPVRFLAQSGPLANLSALGRPLVAWWLEHLAAAGAKHVRILAADRPEQIRALVGDGSRWEIKVEVVAESGELTPAAARTKYCGSDTNGWLAQPNDACLMDHFPGLPEHPLFKSYAHWFNALRALMPRMTKANCSGAKEIRPGVWLGAHARVAPDAELRAPCWIGAHSVVGQETIIGPMAVLEDRVMIEPGVEISNSAVAPETFVGRMTELKDSLANGSILINWRTASCTRVPDAILMCSLATRRHRVKSGNWLGRFAALLFMVLTAPLAIIPILWAKFRKQPAFSAKVAVRPYLSTEPGMMETLVYHELARGWGWTRSWPQLWNIVKGDFAWVGNRPLSPGQVGDLSNDFERLWLAAPVGLISLADAEGAIDALEARACASMYASQANWRLDVSIMARAFVAATKRSFTALF